MDCWSEVDFLSQTMILREDVKKVTKCLTSVEIDHMSIADWEISAHMAD
jgi:hypothetical protein